MSNVTRKFVMAAAGVMMSATAALAQNVVNFEGSVNVRDETPGGGGSFLLIDFLTGATAGFGTAGTFTTVRETDLAGVSLGQTGSSMDLRASSTGFTGLPMTNFVTVGGYTFTLTGSSLGNAFGPVSLFPVGGNTIAAFDVMGTVMGGAFGTASRTFGGTFTTQFNNVTPQQLVAQIDQGGTANASFSATLNIAGPTQVVPEPSTYLLLATGIGALGMVARRRRTTV